jgi:hypothetical protein
VKFNSSFRLESLQIFYEHDDSHLSFLSYHPLHLWCAFLRNYSGSIRGIMSALFDFIVTRPFGIVILWSVYWLLRAGRPRNHGTIPGRGKWLVFHWFYLVMNSGHLPPPPSRKRRHMDTASATLSAGGLYRNIGSVKVLFSGHSRKCMKWNSRRVLLSVTNDSASK